MLETATSPSRQEPPRDIDPREPNWQDTDRHREDRRFSESILRCASFATPRGPLLAYWSDSGLQRIDWSGNPPQSPAIPEDDQRLRAFGQALADYFSGACWALDDLTLDTGGWSPFFGRVYRACRQIPAGQTASYAELARQAGSPKAARAVGQAMAQNRLPLVIPCHRVLGSGGRLGGYSGPGGLATKRWLLAHESADREMPTQRS